MKFSFKFSNLIGSVFSGGNLLFSPDGNSLLSPVGNRVTHFDLVNDTSVTLAAETREDISVIALDPLGRLLVAVDTAGKGVVVSVARRTVLHYVSFNGPVEALKFSPCGQYLAVSSGKKVQLWLAPPKEREFSPLVRLRQYGGHTDDVVVMDWSSDSRFLVTGSRDNTARIWTVAGLHGYVPFVFSGHRQRLSGVFFGAGNEVLYTVAKDGAVLEWRYDQGDAAEHVIPPDPRGLATQEDDAEGDEQELGPDVDADDLRKVRLRNGADDAELRRRAFGKWRLQSKHFFNQDRAVVSSCAFHAASGLLVVGFSTGVFSLHELPSFASVHTLSISNCEVDAAAVNATGDWLAFGSSALGQLLVWEWKSETYVLKQQGHSLDMTCLAYSPDGRFVTTGGDDGKVKVWDTSSGFCFATFTEHEGAVSGLCFPAQSNTIFSASLDGSVRAYDLGRYRNFRTMVAPQPTQFSCVACDPSGEIVCAGAIDLFDIWVWSVQTGRLLDVLSGHEGPVVSLAFGPFRPILVSGSWDRTVKVWEVFDGSKTATETHEHGAIVLAVAFRPDGKQFASSGLDGNIMFWDVREGQVEGYIEGRRDIAGGRKATDLITKDNMSGTKHFSSLCYSADGSAVIAGGNSRFVCIYDATRRLLLKKYVVSQNVRLGGTLDYLGKVGVTDAGHRDLIDDDEDSSDERNVFRKRPEEALPGAKRSASKRLKNREVWTKCVRFAPTGRQWAAASSDGLLVFSLDDAADFDPADLDVDVTPEAALAASDAGLHAKALLVALRLNEEAVMERVLHRVPPEEVAAVAGSVPPPFLRRMLDLLAVLVGSHRHLEYYLVWCSHLFQSNGRALRERAPGLLTSLRALQRAVVTKQQDMAKLAEGNLYALDFILLPRPSKRTHDGLEEDQEE